MDRGHRAVCTTDLRWLRFDSGPKIQVTGAWVRAVDIQQATGMPGMTDATQHARHAGYVHGYQRRLPDHPE